MSGLKSSHRSAVEALSGTLTGTHWIAGERVAGDATTAVEDPATGEPAADLALGDAADVDSAVAAAERAAEGWAALGDAKRAARVGEWAGALEDARADLARAMTVEMGKPLAFAREEVDELVEFLEYYTAVERAETGDLLQRGRDNHTYTRREPYGVVGLVLPWNYPLELFAWKAGAALATGNTLVVKPSRHAPLALTRAVELSAAALPDGVVNVVNGTGSDVGTAIVEHDRVRKVSFTGSVPVGRTVMEGAAGSITPVTLELGGKNPFVVFPDADAEAAAEAAAGGIFFNAGQSCGAASRAIVHESVHDEFLDALVERARSDWQPGDPLEEGTTMGPLAHGEQYETTVEYVESGRAEGAELACGGAPVDGGPYGDGLFYEPTVFEGVAPEMRIAREEIFGPVLSVFRFSEYEEAMAMANDTEYGLSAGVATEDMGRAHRAAADLEAGSVWVNEWYNVGPGTPFGGYKQSGIGRECAAATLEEYRQTKTVSISLD